MTIHSPRVPTTPSPSPLFMKGDEIFQKWLQWTGNFYWKLVEASNWEGGWFGGREGEFGFVMGVEGGVDF